MQRLREIFADLSLSNVDTFIASGNVLFDSIETSSALEPVIAAALRTSLGYEVVTYIRRTSELRRIAAERPFGNVELTPKTNVLYVGFLHGIPATEAAARLTTVQSAVDEFCIVDREIFWLRRRQNGDALFPGSRLEKALGMPVTARNVTTINRLVAMLPASS